ncbi:MAG: multidrug effflux MFS transporter [Hyphomicrobiales bacterium]|nr:multidrug effflux MFS transporter [Hyphomicrobiales bacterium]
MTPPPAPAPQAPATPRLSLLALLISVTAIGPMALNIYLPSMPGLQRVFDVDYAVVQLTLTLYLIGLAAAQLVYGPLSDRLGRRPVLLAGLSLSLVGTLSCLVAPSIAWLIVGRLVQAVGACAGMVLARAMIRDLFPRERAASVMGYVTMAMVVAPMVAPTIGGYLDEFLGWRASFVFVAAATVAVIAAAAALLPETHGGRPGQAGGSGPLEILRAWDLMANPAFRRYALQVGFTTSVFFSFVGGAPYIMVELMGQPPSRYGLYVIMVAAMYMTGNFTTGRVAVRVGPDRMIAWGTSLSLLGTVLLVAVYAAGVLMPVTLFACMAVVALGNGMSIPNGVAGAISVDPHRAGAASGLAGFLQMSVGAGATALIGLLLADSAMPLVALMLLGAVGGSAVHNLGRRRES